MARFKFRLEILLILALNKEEDIKKELASWHKLIREAKIKRQQIILNITKSLKEKSLKKDINEIILYENYLASLLINQKKTEEEITYFEQEKEKTIFDLQEAMKERKILEKLKEKKLEEYIEEENRLDQKETDEIGTKIFTDGR